MPRGDGERKVLLMDRVGVDARDPIGDAGGVRPKLSLPTVRPIYGSALPCWFALAYKGTFGPTPPTPPAPEAPVPNKGEAIVNALVNNG